MKKVIYFLGVFIFERTFSAFDYIVLFTLIFSKGMPFWAKVLGFIATGVVSTFMRSKLGIPIMQVKGKNHVKII